MTAAGRNVASWAKKAREATAARDRWIRTMRDEGASLRAIGKAADLSHTAVGKILRNTNEEAG
jgi:hypothetical protein